MVQFRVLFLHAMTSRGQKTTLTEVYILLYHTTNNDDNAAKERNPSSSLLCITYRFIYTTIDVIQQQKEQDGSPSSAALSFVPVYKECLCPRHCVQKQHATLDHIYILPFLPPPNTHSAGLIARSMVLRGTYSGICNIHICVYLTGTSDFVIFFSAIVYRGNGLCCLLPQLQWRRVLICLSF